MEGVLAAFSLTVMTRSGFTLSSTTIAVTSLVVLAGGNFQFGFFANKIFSVVPSITTAARAPTSSTYAKDREQKTEDKRQKTDKKKPNLAICFLFSVC